jgi:hypothetical protein
MRCFDKLPATLALSLVIALPATAAAPLASLADTAPLSWTQARAAALASPELMADARATVAEAAFPGSVTDAAWREAVMAEILVAAEQYPGEALRVRQLRGIDPAWYLRARKPIPLATRELPRMKLSAGALLEAWLFHRDFPTKRVSDAYPAHVQDRVDELRAAETLALEEALLTALARTRHPSSSALLIEQLASESARRQQLAAVLLGETRLPAAEAKLGQLLDDSRVRGPLRSAALIGLGKARSLPALQRLVVEAQVAERSSDERRALIGALANVGNRFAHEARPRPQSDSIRRQASDALIRLLPQVASNPSVADTLAQGIATVGHPSATASLNVIAGGPDSADKRLAQRALALHARAIARR